MTGPLPAAHGLRLSGCADACWLDVTGAEHWPRVRCVAVAAPGAPDIEVADDGRTLRIRDDIGHGDVVHPLLGRAASFLALARGGDAMHAGALLGAAGAWLVIGPKRAGKSTLLAGLARAGSEIVTDDVLVLHDGRALAGPRCIDLRPDAPGLGPGVPVRRDDPRHRIELGSIGAEHPLAGVIHLEWSDGGCTVTGIGHRDAIARLLVVQAEKGFPRRPGVLLDLAGLPTVCLRRPRTPAGLAASVDAVRGTVSARGPAQRKISPSPVVLRP